VHLTQSQRDELSAVSRQAIGRVARLSPIVLLSDRGFTVAQMAAIHACGQDVVRLWLPRYEREGVAGREDEPRSGRPPKDPLAGISVDAQASQSPPCSGPVQTCWTVAWLAAFLARRLRLVLACTSIRRSLHQLGWRWARPRLAPARKPDPQAEAKMAALVWAAQQAAQGLAHLLSLDESDVHLLPRIRSMGMKGPRVRIPTPGTHRRRACFGALAVVSGQWFWTDQERQLAVHCVALLQRLATQYPTGPLYLALDNAPTPPAKVVGKWVTAHPRVQVLWLPKDAAHAANPVERIWGPTQVGRGCRSGGGQQRGGGRRGPPVLHRAGPPSRQAAQRRLIFVPFF
jgi:transposase